MPSVAMSRIVVWTCFCLFTAGAARAEIVKCVSSTGEITYTQTTCPPVTNEVALPEDMSRDTGSSFRNSSIRTVLSPRAKELKTLPRKDLARIEKQCMSPVYWNDEDCLALREIRSTDRAQREYSADARMERQRSQCDRGVHSACVPPGCGRHVRAITGNPYIEYIGEDADIRACARALSLPASASWAQVALSEPGEEFKAKFVCLPRIQIQDQRGEATSWRGALVVMRSLGVGDSPDPGFETPTVGKQVFKTIEEAATAGCAELYEAAKTVKPRGKA